MRQEFEVKFEREKAVLCSVVMACANNAAYHVHFLHVESEREATRSQWILAQSVAIGVQSILAGSSFVM